ncbi:hypothetical protein M9458_056874, partial [Cirrhinus mrigala]
GRLPTPLHNTESDYDREGQDDLGDSYGSPEVRWDLGCHLRVPRIVPRVRAPPSPRGILGGHLDA